MATCDAAQPRGWSETTRAEAFGRHARPVCGPAAPLGTAFPILIVDHAMRAREHVALRSMFAARKRVFVDLLQWNLAVLAGCFEVDRRDGPGATYLIVAGPDREHRGSVRLLRPPSAAIEAFGDRIFLPGERGVSVAEVTHFCLSPDIAAGDRRCARDQLLHGLVDHALAQHIHCLVGIVEQRLVRPIEDLGWACRRLGEIRSDCGRATMAVAVDVDATTPARLAGAGVARPTAAGQVLS